MVQKISVPVSVSFTFDHIKNRVSPRWIIWNGRLHAVIKLGLHHTYKEGSVLYHVFSVMTKTLFLRLVLDSSNLHWRLEEISDGLPN